MTTYQELEAIVYETGLWHGGRRDSHGFVLSPEAFELPAADVGELDALAKSVHNCLLGVSRLMAIAANSALHGSSDGYSQLYRALTKGSAYKLPTVRPANIPLLAKVDLMVDRHGCYKIAEIDATNPRSLGYSVLGRKLVSHLMPSSRQLPGVVEYLANHLHSQKTTEITFLYGDTQRFYEPEFRILAQALALCGIAMKVINETEVAVRDGVAVVRRTGESLPGWYMDLPLMNKNPELIKWLREMASQSAIQFVVPPKHFLSSKALLAMLSNPGGDRRLEALLETQIAESDLGRVRQALPTTWLMHPGVGEIALSPSGHVLKRVVASGMKGVWLAGDPGFDEALQASTTKAEEGNYVLQARVLGRELAWTTLSAPAQAERHADYQLRLTAYCTREGLKDLAVTACRGPRVHGGKAAILTGTVIV